MINVFKELGSRCWYCANPNPVHQKCSGFEVNACRSCINLGGMGGAEGLEVFRHDLAVRKVAPGIDLKLLADPLSITTPEQSHMINQILHRTQAKIGDYKFHFEELAFELARDVDPGTKAWHAVKSLPGAELLKELGSKCWYCGSLLWRHKQYWRNVKIPLPRGGYIEGSEIEKEVPYYGRPTHDNFQDFTVNSCRSCTSRRHRKPIEEFRKWLGVRIMPEGGKLQALEAALQAGMPDGVQEREVVEQAIQQLNAKAQAYLFYVEELMIRCARQWAGASSSATVEDATLAALAEVSPQQIPWD